MKHDKPRKCSKHLFSVSISSWYFPKWFDGRLFLLCINWEPPGHRTLLLLPSEAMLPDKTLFFLIEDRTSVPFKYRSFACYFPCSFCFPLGYKPLLGAFSLLWRIDFWGQMRILEVIKPHSPSALTVAQSQRHRFKERDGLGVTRVALWSALSYRHISFAHQY